MEKKYNTSKLLILTIIILLLASVFPNIKSVLSLDLTLPWLVGWRQVKVGPYLITVKSPYLRRIPYTTPFAPIYHAESIYFSVPFPERPGILRSFILRLITGGPLEIPQRIYLTDSRFGYYLTEGVKFDEGSKFVYFHGWCPPRCYRLADVRASIAEFYGWDLIPAGNILKIEGIADYVLYSTDNRVITSRDWPDWERLQEQYTLPLPLKSFLAWGGEAGATRSLRISLEPVKVIKDLAVFIGDFKVFEKKEDVFGIQSIDLTPQLAQITPYIKQVGDRVEIPLSIKMIDAQENLIENPIVSLTLDAIQPVETITTHTRKKLTIKTTDALTNQVLQSETVPAGLHPFLATDRTNLEIFDEKARVKIILNDIRLPFYKDVVKTCNLDFDVVIIGEDRRRKTISIDIPEECQGAQNILVVPVGDLAGPLERAKVLRCEKGAPICVPVNFNLDLAAKEVKITAPKLSEIIIGNELKELAAKIVPANFSFKRNLRLGTRSIDVKYLQAILNLDPETELTKSGPGSFGNETTYFGPLTRNAVIRFQEKYSSEILAPLGLTKGPGFVGRATRAKLNEILGR